MSPAEAAHAAREARINAAALAAHRGPACYTPASGFARSATPEEEATRLAQDEARAQAVAAAKAAGKVPEIARAPREATRKPSLPRERPRIRRGTMGKPMGTGAARVYTSRTLTDPERQRQERAARRNALAKGTPTGAPTIRIVTIRRAA